MPRDYIVASGDTLEALAARFFGDKTRGSLIASATGIALDAPLTAGEQLIIPDVDLTPPLVANGKPKVDFEGTLPYASEVFGVYQPLAGWFGQRNIQRVAPASVGKRELNPQKRQKIADSGRPSQQLLKGVLDTFTRSARGVLSPVGLVNLFREYFFEFDTFLGAPAGHLWLSPGGTVEVIESSSRRTLVERSAEQSAEVTRKSEETLTDQDDVADAVKEDNANDTKLGASASAGANFAGIYHGDASGSFSMENTIKKSSEVTHKHSRTQSAKASSEIHRNFKTTFKTVTESTDTTSRRYVVQNTGLTLVNYELRRKMRKVGIQVQHIATRLGWQVFVDNPGKDLGMGEMVHVIPGPDLSHIQKPEPLPPQLPKVVPFPGIFPIMKTPGTKNSPNINMNFVIHAPNSLQIGDYGNEYWLIAKAHYQPMPPSPGYTLAGVALASAKSQGADVAFVPQLPIAIDMLNGSFDLYVDRLNTGDLSPIQLSFSLTWDPPLVDPARAQYDLDMASYDSKVAEAQRAAYAEGVRERLKLVSNIVPRPSEDLRREEREWVYGRLVRELRLIPDPHLGAELIRQIFDVDEMLYFVAPEYWRPFVNQVPMNFTEDTVGRYPVPPAPSEADILDDYPLAGNTVVSWYSHTARNNALDADRNVSDEWRVNYLITESTRVAPLGSSLGWLIQMDGDERRNEFLNAAWVKAVLPIRGGHELEGLDWLGQAKVEGEDGLGLPYPYQSGDPVDYKAKTIGEVLTMLATQLQVVNTQIGTTLAVEKVFETGYDPLAGGFRPALPYTVFDEWVEVLPTDQVVAVEVTYDPRSGVQL